jgi:hypothetical protein
MKIDNFKFFRKPFNTEDYDITDFRFLGVTPMFGTDDNRLARKMIYVFTDGSIVPAETIYEDHDAFNRADIFEVRGNQVFLWPRGEGLLSSLRTPYNLNEEV